LHQIKLVVTDLDGTLLAPDATISQEAIEIVAELSKRNVRFSFITGRPHISAARFAKQLTLTAPMVTCNGAVICDGDEVLSRCSFGLSPLKKLMQTAASNGFTVLLFQDGTEYALSKTAWVRKRQAAGRIVPIKEADEINWETGIAEKINIMEQGVSLDVLSGLLAEVEGCVSITKYGDTGCEIVAKGITKAAGLRNLCGLLGIKEENVLAIGDNENDNELLAAAGIGAAVANASPFTKKFADYLCEFSYTEGFVEAVRKIVLGFI